MYIRYGTAHDRGFEKCLDKLLMLRKERRELEIGFERKKREEAKEIRQQEAHEAKMKPKSSLPKDLSALTGIPVKRLTGIVTTAIRNFLLENGKTLPAVSIPEAA